MRSGATRAALVATTWIALAAAGFFIFTTQERVRTASTALRQVDLHARETADALADLQLAQHAYVATGQGVAFWMPKVATTKDTVMASLTALRQSMMSAPARTAVDEATSAVNEFADVDKRARDYLRSGQQLMAGDVIYTEGDQLAAVAGRQVERARLAEHQAFDTDEAELRKRQLAAIGAAGLISGFVAIVLALMGARRVEVVVDKPAGTAVTNLNLNAPAASDEEGVVSHARTVPAAQLPARPAPPAPSVAVHSTAPARNAIVLKATAELATDFARVREREQLERLLSRAADLMDAGGMVVWMADSEQTSNDLRPVLSYGYTPQVLARMTSLPRSADNAAAAAYRTESLQIVPSHPGGPSGAIVAPILGTRGCIGALSAEIKSGGEASEAIHAVAAIVASHLAGVLAVEPEEAEAHPEVRTAAQA
ncbi:MAG TPA: hypothetical protein VH583_22610 [Vicinamibacterales bacterium]|jgi:hypothetical protein